MDYLKNELSVYLFFVSVTLINAQIQTVPHPNRSLLNNVVWSSDSKMIAYETLDTEGAQVSDIYIYALGADQPKQLIKPDESSEFFSSNVSKKSNRLPAWSEDNRVLYLLYSGNSEEPHASERLLGKTPKIDYATLPFGKNDDIDPIYNNSNIGQYSPGLKSGISEYHLWHNQQNGIEFIFAKLKNKMHLIFYYGGVAQKLRVLPKWGSNISSDVNIDSFDLATNGRWMALVTGTGIDKRIIVVEFEWEGRRGGKLRSANYCGLHLEKAENGILQEPSFNPVDATTMAYLEFIPDDETMMVKQLHVVTSWPTFTGMIGSEEGGECAGGNSTMQMGENRIVKNSIYLNIENNVPRPNSTNYSWHPDGKRIFYINTSRNIEYVDISTSALQHQVIFAEQITQAEQITISPDGQHMAVLTHQQFDDSEALTAIRLIPIAD